MIITLKNGNTLELENGLTVLDVAKQISEGLARNAVCAKIDGNLVDLSAVIDKDINLEIITLSDAEGLNVYRHTTSHVLAQALKTIYPTCKLAIGPTIENGFYYDVEFKTPISQDDLPKIEAEMQKIIKSDLPIERFTLTKTDAAKLIRKYKEPYKVSLIAELPPREEISFYK